MLTFAGVRKAFGDLVAVDGLDLEVNSGEIFGLLGPNGAGKTTTVNMAVGLVAPDSGTIDVAGCGSPRSTAARRKLGLAPQALAIYEDLTGSENLRFFAELFGLTRGECRTRVSWALDFVGLTDRAATRVGDWSGGMKRRLNLAAALLHDPPVLLFDEPTAGVDPQSRDSILNKIIDLRDDGRTIVYTTHYMEEATRLCDRVGIMDHGKMLAIDTVEALVTEYGGPSILEVETDDGPVSHETDNPLETLERLGRELELRSFRLVQPNLENVFFNLTGRQLRD